MATAGWVLGIDIGTSRSGAAIARAGGAGDRAVTSLEVGGNRLIASLVVLDPSGELMVGAAAHQQAAIHPDRVERTPKRYLGGSAPLLLGGVPVAPTTAIAQLIKVFLDEGKLRNGGSAPEAVVITHPVRWGTDRKTALEEAALEAGCPRPNLVPEPVAAAAHYASEAVEIGDFVGVYDLGGGTFDTAVLRRTADGFETVGAPGGDEFVGGESFDHLIFEQLGAVLETEEPGAWDEIQYSDDRKWTRAAAELLAQSRMVKEAVSAYPAAQALLPILDRAAVFSRVTLEELIAPHLERTVDEMVATITSAGISPDDLAALYLVGGSSRIPLVTRMMTARFGDRVTTRDEPKSVVALGAALIAGRLTDPALSRPRFRYRRSWNAHNGTQVSSLAALSAGMIAVSLDRITQYGLDGMAQWTAGVPERPTSPPGLAPSTVAVGCGAAVLLYSQSDGRVLWAGSASDRVLVPPSVTETDLVIGDAGGTVTNISSRTGAVEWMLSVGAPVTVPLGVLGPALFIAADRVLYRADRRTGVVSWGLPVPSSIAAVHTVSSSAIVVVCADGTSYGVDAVTGAARWAARIPESSPGPGEASAEKLSATGSLVSPGGTVLQGATVFIADETGRLHSLDVERGVLEWSSEVALAAKRIPGSTMSIAMATDAIHVATPNGLLAAFDAESGELLARQSVHNGLLGPLAPFPEGVALGVAESVAYWVLEPDEDVVAP